MKIILFICTLIMFTENSILFDFNDESRVRDWQIVDDGVMGGLSRGQFSINAEGHGVFEGQVSLENNGGFSSVRHGLHDVNVSSDRSIVLHIKGDGKQYQFRVKDSMNHYYSFIHAFQTSGDWQEIVIPLNSMYASFRGRKVNVPNFFSDQIEEVRFLIANKKMEEFKLLIDKIEIR